MPWQRQPNRTDVLSAALGYVSMTNPRDLFFGASDPGTQLLRGSALFLPAKSVVTNIVLHASVAASGLTLAKVGIYSKAGTKIAESASAHASFNGVTGLIITPLLVPYVSPDDEIVFPSFLFVGTTAPQLLRHATAIGYNDPLPGNIPETFGVTGQTDLPSPANLNAGGYTRIAFWFGVT